MRPGQNKRMRGRNNNNNNGSNRKGPNPLTRSYESNGPDVKIRGTAHHVAEKYLQLARDAQSSGDPVMAESYLQHAEHYFRLIAAAQQAQQQAAYGYQRSPTEQAEADDDSDDDDFSSLPDRFASPAERVVTPPPAPPQPYADRQPYNNGGDRQPYEPRQDRYERSGQGQDRQAPERQGQDRQGQDRQGQDRAPAQDRPAYQDRQDTRPERYDNRQERFEARQDRNGRTDRPAYAERPYGDRNGQDRNGQDRTSPDRTSQDNRAPAERAIPERAGQDRNGQNRDYDNRGHRNNNRGPREFRTENNVPREQRQPDVEPVATALPAFITTPVRIQAEAPSVIEPVATLHEAPPSAPETASDDSGFAMRPRRRRRTKAEFSEADGSDAAHGATAPDPVGD